MLLEGLNKLNPISQGMGLVQSAFGFGKGKTTTTQEQYDELVHYFKHASSAYALVKLGRLNGASIVHVIYEMLTDSHGYVACDNEKKEIIVAFRGSVTPTNFAVDFMFVLVEFSQTLIPGAQVHTGFKLAWKAVADRTIACVKEQLDAHPDYKLVIVGHSLGGAMASIAAVDLKYLHKDRDVRVYTYGAPRVGDAAFAKYATDLLGAKNIHRVVHACDGVPTMVPRPLGFRHFGTEYWHLSPAGPSRTFICNGAGDYEEDPEGSMRVPTTGINPDHLVYFVIPYITPFYI